MRRNIATLHVVSSEFHIERVQAIFDAVMKRMRVALRYYSAPSHYPSHRLHEKMAEERLKTEYFIRNEAPMLESNRSLTYDEEQLLHTVGKRN